MEKIKFGTDGWRAIIGKEFTTENVARVSEAVAKWLLSKRESSSTSLSVVLGHDCRFGGELFTQTVAKVLIDKGITVYKANGFVSTPMISLGTVKRKADLGIIITASHNPSEYNGYKLKGHYGGPLLPEQVTEIENLIPEKSSIDISNLTINSSLLKPVDLESEYCKQIQKKFDLKLINSISKSFAYDAMYGSGQNVIRRLLPKTTLIHCSENPSFEGIAPEPIAKNLKEISSTIKKSKNKLISGLATDGDADRIGIIDNKGNFIDSHHLILLLIHYLCKYKKMKGKVVMAFSVTPRVKKMCEHYNLQLQVVKIGFKHICEIMIREDVLIGGEESGGIAIKGHIPERDGIWIGLTIWEFMAKSGKSIKDLIAEVYAITGSFAFERNDLHLTEEVKNKIVDNCRNNRFNHFGIYKVKQLDNLDGWKYYFNNSEWLLIRASGTEPVLRTYAESSNQKNAFKILIAAKKSLLENTN